MNYIFDFDGTIADSLPAMIAIYNKVIRNNEDPLTPEEIRSLRGMSSRKALRQLGVRWWQVPKLLLRGLPHFQAMAANLDSFTGLRDVIKKLYERGDKLYIVTSNTRDSVDKFLAAQKLEPYFIDAVTGAGLFNKAKHIRRLMKAHG
ncbi:MAG: HAD hydrolase-like protein, partial [Candidatus Saccharimonadales bacterium]